MVIKLFLQNCTIISQLSQSEPQTLQGIGEFDATFTVKFLQQIFTKNCGKNHDKGHKKFVVILMHPLL
jgi:hypothetical protein